VAPEPLTHQVAAPLQPALRDRTMPRPIASAFQPQSTAEDLAMARSPDSIQTNPHNLPTLPTNAPVLKSKSFSGIRPQDLPFQVGAGDAISGGSAIPIAVGNASAKTALAYGGPSLKDASGKHPAGISPIGLGSRMADTASLGAGAPSTIELSGTGGTGNAPTGAASGSVLQDRKGTGGGGLVSRTLFGSGGSGYGTAIAGGMPSAAQQLDNQIAAAASSG